MDPIHIMLIACSFFFALNMGGSGMAPAFSVALGANIIKRHKAVALYIVFVAAGALIFGKYVAKTLGSGLIPAEIFNEKLTLIVIFSAASALFIANLLKIPESTSWVIVFAISAAGVYYSNLNRGTILYRILPAWILLPITSFLLSFLLARIFYPLRGSNFKLFEYFSKHEWKMKAFVLSGSCYVAMAIGANNVANVVGPLSAAGLIDTMAGLAIISPVFGLGGAVFRSPSKTVGREIVPLGVFTATIVNFTFGSLLILASWLGIPQSCVQMNAFSIFAVSLVKDGSSHVLRHQVIRKMMLLWVITPVIASGLTILLLRIFV